MKKEVQLLILGNGFDKHCGLDSDYESFFKTAVLDSSAESNYPKMRADCNGFWECLLFEYLKKNDDKRNLNWCNIERIIKTTLFSICFNEKSVQKNNLGYGIWWSALNCIKAANDPTEYSKTIFDPIERYLYLYCAHFFFDVIKSNDKKPDQDMLKALIDNLFQELRNFEKRFCNYLKNIIFPNGTLNEKYVINAVNTLVGLTYFTKNKFHNMHDIIHTEDRPVIEQVIPNTTLHTCKKINVLSNQLDKLATTNILSFNYTNIFDILETEYPCLYSNVHGKICVKNCTNDCGVANIIFGVDDTLLESTNDTYGLRLFSKTYRKMFDTKDVMSILPDKDNHLVTIKFYGHSLDEADYSYFQSIFDYYDLYGNSNVGLAFCFSKGYENIDGVYSLINEYGDTLNNKAQGKNLIHKLLIENRLKICEFEKMPTEISIK